MLAIGGVQLFAIGSCIGYMASTFYFYRMQVQQSFGAFEQYPELMKLHLIMNFPLMRYQQMSLRPGLIEREKARIRKSWHLTSMLASAYQTARPSIEVSVRVFPMRALAYLCRMSFYVESKL